MIPEAELTAYVRSYADLTTLTARDLRRIWRTIDTNNMKREYPRLLESLRAIVTTYGEVAAQISADFYDTLRDAAGLSYKPAPLAATAADERIEVMTRVALGSLWSDTPNPDAALSRMARGASRLALEPGRATMLAAAERDDVRCALVPQGAATCPFCLMLASRGAVYADIKPEIHDGCDCGLTIVYTPDDLPEVNRTLQAEWREVAKGSDDPRTAWREHIAATRSLA